MANTVWSDCDRAVERIAELCGAAYGRVWQAELQRHRRSKSLRGLLPTRADVGGSPEEVIKLARGLRAVRRGLGWSQTRLAHQAGVARYTISRLEIGYRVSPETRHRIANALGVTVLELLSKAD